jgi:predicted ATPase
MHIQDKCKATVKYVLTFVAFIVTGGYGSIGGTVAQQILEKGGYVVVGVVYHDVIDDRSSMSLQTRKGWRRCKAGVTVVPSTYRSTSAIGPR